MRGEGRERVLGEERGSGGQVGGRGRAPAGEI